MEDRDAIIEQRRRVRMARAAHIIQMAAARPTLPTPEVPGVGPDPAADARRRAERHYWLCVVCLENIENFDVVATLQCGHRFHHACIDQWAAQSLDNSQWRAERAQQLGEDEPDIFAQCPSCRQPLVVSNIGPQVDDEDEPGAARPASEASAVTATDGADVPLPSTPPPHDMPPWTEFTPDGAWVSANASPQGSPQGGGDEDDLGAAAEDDRHDSAMMDIFPWWPADLPTSSELDPAAVNAAFHSNTQLSNGQLSMIVDPGAWTNLMGEDLARQLARRAVEAGHRPRQVLLERPLNVQGVGNGTQQCTHQVVTPIAVADDQGRVVLHSLTAPIVRGAGAQLPGLLGLRSLESLGAVLDMGRQELVLPGGGDRSESWPAGTTRIPLRKAPSGHLVMIIDEYERAVANRGSSALPERSLQLHSQTGDSETEPEGSGAGASSSLAPAPAEANFGTQ